MQAFFHLLKATLGYYKLQFGTSNDGSELTFEQINHIAVLPPALVA